MFNKVSHWRNCLGRTTKAIKNAPVKYFIASVQPKLTFFFLVFIDKLLLAYFQLLFIKNRFRGIHCIKSPFQLRLLANRVILLVK